MAGTMVWGLDTGIAVVGWGSLIWDPRQLPVRSSWQPDGPELPVEFAYLSAVLCVPTSIGIAMLRHRLLDIDVLINRTLVYGATVATLGVLYVSAIVALQTVLRPFTQGDELAVALSTLGAIAVFAPIRANIQRAVDRRFYRSRYDATRTLDSLALRLRDQVDLEALRAELLGAVRDTMQPAHASLWLRDLASALGALGDVTTDVAPIADLVVFDATADRSFAELRRIVARDDDGAWRPVLVIAASDDLCVAGLEAGADAVVGPDVPQAEFVARARALLRIKARHAAVEKQAAQFTDWTQSLVSRVAEQVEELQRVERLRRFLAPQVAQVVAHDEKLLESHRREIAAVFCDLHGFTAFSEVAEPEEVMGVLREYHDALGALVFEYEATLERRARTRPRGRSAWRWPCASASVSSWPAGESAGTTLTLASGSRSATRRSGGSASPAAPTTAPWGPS